MFCGCATQNASLPETKEWAEPIELAGVPNFHRVSDDLYRSAQPTAEGMENLKEMGIERIIAKATRADHAKILRTLGVSEIVSPEREMGEKIANKLVHPNYIDYFPLQPGISVRELAPPASFLGRRIDEIDLHKKWKVELLAVRDASRKKVEMLPPPGLILEGKDRLVVLGRDADLDRLGKVE